LVQNQEYLLYRPSEAPDVAHVNGDAAEVHLPYQGMPRLVEGLVFLNVRTYLLVFCVYNALTYLIISLSTSVTRPEGAPRVYWSRYVSPAQRRALPS
jgi:hypothetical protein